MTSPCTQKLVDSADVMQVGGKAASLGGLLRAGFPVPDGFVINTAAFRLAQTEGRRRREESFTESADHEATPYVLSCDGSNQASASNATTTARGIPAASAYPRNEAVGIRSTAPLPGLKRHECRAPLSSLVASRDNQDATLTIPAQVAEEISRAYKAMGAGVVAVRSSATAEDSAAASMAGQCETFLEVEGEANLLDAVQRCWASLDTPQIRAYLTEHGIEPASVAMAVVVQRLVPADVAGVLFTLEPNGNGHVERAMLIEANWGLGETVVSGRAQPDQFRVDRDAGRLLSSEIADKQVYHAPGAGKERPVQEALRKKACLADSQLQILWQLGKQVETHFGAPQDIEWAIHNGKLYLLQSRPITTHRETEATEALLETTRQYLRNQLAAGRGPWVLHNLAETLPHPTPLTWSLLRKFMSGSGGFGLMYRQAGFEPAPLVDREGFLDLIAGRVYMDAARAPELFGANFPFAYDPEKLASDPEISEKPPTVPRGSYSARAKAVARLSKAGAKLHELAASADRGFREKTAPAVAGSVAAAARLDLSSLSNEDLIVLWEEREKKVLNVFGAETLLPGLICGTAWSELEAFLHEHFWDEDADTLLQLISVGGEPDHTVVTDAELHEVGLGKRSLDAWLAKHGHRGPGEFDLAEPRWRERWAPLSEMAALMAAGEPPLERYRRGCEAATREADRLRSQLPAAEAKEFDSRLELVRRYLPFREDGKDLLMLGYDMLRAMALEAGRRLDIGDGVFYLTRDEVFEALRSAAVPAGAATDTKAGGTDSAAQALSAPLRLGPPRSDLRKLIEQRQLTHRAENRLTLPRVIDGKAIERLGETPDVKPGADSYPALPVSAGQATGPARILHSATDAGPSERGYILVCPSTDPAWTPLFVSAAGLVLERGGALSHGAVVAREMGLPAVVLPDATRLFKEGQPLTINGNQGWVGRAERIEPLLTAAESSPEDPRIVPWLAPPPPGRKERQAARLRNVAATFWTAYLLGFFLLPREYVYQPSLSFLDVLLWPLVHALGKPAVVAVVAAGIALLTLLVQRFATDNRRLREAKRRAALLVKQAAKLPEGAPRRKALLQLALPVNLRVFAAATVPLALLLGIMVVSFVWLKDRMEPSVARGMAGGSAQVVAMVNSDWSNPVQIELPAPLSLDETTPASRSLPPIRQTLERLLAVSRQADPTWELQLVPELSQPRNVKSLEDYLNAGVPPQGIAWMLRAPPETVGRFPVKVSVDGQPSATVNVVLGEELPPSNPLVAGRAHSPIRELRVVYPSSAQKPSFWKPLSGVATNVHLPLASTLAAMDIGWLWLYLLTYLPVFFIGRAALKVA